MEEIFGWITTIVDYGMTVYSGIVDGGAPASTPPYTPPPPAQSPEMPFAGMSPAVILGGLALLILALK